MTAPIVVIAQDLVVESVPVEVFDVHGDRLILGCVQPSVQTEIAHDKIHAAIPVEITRHDSIPPAVAFLESARAHSLELPAPLVPINNDRHPLADYDEVRAPVSGDVRPHGIGHHPDLRQAGRRLLREVTEVTLPVVSQKHARRIDAVASGNNAPSDKQIGVAIAVEVRSGDPRPAEVLNWQTSFRLSEIPAPIVQV